MVFQFFAQINHWSALEILEKWWFLCLFEIRIIGMTLSWWKLKILLESISTQSKKIIQFSPPSLHPPDKLRKNDKIVKFSTWRTFYQESKTFHYYYEIIAEEKAKITCHDDEKNKENYQFSMIDVIDSCLGNYTMAR